MQLMKLENKLRKLPMLKGNIPALAISDFISSNGWSIFEVIWQPFVLSLGATIPILGGLSSIHTILGSGLQAITGRFSDFIGRKSLQMVSFVLGIVGVTICLIASVWIFLIPAIICFGLSTALMEPANMSMIAESVKERKRGMAFGIIAVTWFIPGLYATIIGGYLATLYGFSLTFMIIFLGDFLSLLIFAVFVKDTLSEKKKVDFRAILNSLKGLVRPRFGLSRFYVAVVLHNFRWALGSLIFFGMLIETYNFTLFQLGILEAFFCAVTSLSQIPFGWLVDRYGRKTFLIISELVRIIPLIGYIFSNSFFEFLIFRGMMGVAVATWIPAFQAYISDAVPEDERARHIGDLNALGGLIAFPGPFIGGILFDALGFDAPILTSLILVVTTLLVLITIKKK
jgi:MFS family permease